MSGTCSGGSRRQFLATTAAGGAALALSGAAPPVPPDGGVPKIKLGKTGQAVTKLGMGTSWALSPSFVQAALFRGVRYIDTSETYENTVAETVIGEVLDRTGLRKDVYLVTKNKAYEKAKGPGAAKVFAAHLDKSLERLKTDYVDCYYLHGLEGTQIELLREPSVRAAFEALKKSGKTRFAGLSCHAANLPEILALAAEVGWIDQVMFKYNFRSVDHDALQRSVDAAAKADLGLVAMKTQGGAENFPDKMAKLQEKGFKKEVAAIKTVWMDDRMHVVVSEMTTRSDLAENVAASREPVTPKEARLLEEHRQSTAHLYCHGCGHLCETAAKGVPVATVLRYLRYYETYGKREQARQLYQALPPISRNLADADLAAAQAACPHGLPVVDLIERADRRLG